MKKAHVIAVLALALTFLCSVTSPAGPVLDRIIQKGELVVGTSGEQPPLSAKTKDGKIIGLDADLSKFMAAAIGVELKMVDMPFPELLPALEKGELDMILSGMTITPKRNLKVAFVGPYYISGKGILTKTQTIASLKDANEMNRPTFTLAALKDSTSQLFVEKLLPNAKLVTTKSLDEAVNLVVNDKVDGLIADYPTCAVAAFRHKDKGLVAGAERFTFEPMGIALPGNDPLLVNLVENFLNMVQGSGDLKKLRQRWFEDASWVKELQ